LKVLESRDERKGGSTGDEWRKGGEEETRVEGERRNEDWRGDGPGEVMAMP
jgi:hypothetical protein